MGRRKGQNSEIILISKSDEHHSASYILQIIHFCYFTFAKSDKDPIEKVCCDYSLHMAVTHWGPEVEAEMAKVVSPEVIRKKFFLVWILALNCSQFYFPSRLASTRSKCSWPTRMSSCWSKYKSGPAVCQYNFFWICSFSKNLKDLALLRDGEIIECFKRTREVGAIAQVRTFQLYHKKSGIWRKILKDEKAKTFEAKLSCFSSSVLQSGPPCPVKS